MSVTLMTAIVPSPSVIGASGFAPSGRTISQPVGGGNFTAATEQICARAGVSDCWGRLAGLWGMCCIPAQSNGEGFVKLVLFQSAPNSEGAPGVMTERGIVDISGAAKKGHTLQLTMQGIIDDFDRLRPALEKLAAEGQAIPADKVQLKAPLPRPGKILCCIANYWEHA